MNMLKTLLALGRPLLHGLRRFRLKGCGSGRTHHDSASPAVSGAPTTASVADPWRSGNWCSPIVQRDKIIVVIVLFFPGINENITNLKPR